MSTSFKILMQRFLVVPPNHGFALKLNFNIKLRLNVKLKPKLNLEPKAKS
jgi:hypothetical protein